MLAVHLVQIAGREIITGSGNNAIQQELAT
jgi:hypothetical protein